MTVALSTTPTTYEADSGTTWTVTSTIAGGNGERWATNALTNGTTSNSQTMNFAFYHQFLVSFNSEVIGGGVGYSIPTISFSQFGGSSSTIAGSSVWVDASSTFSYPVSLSGGSPTSERWQTNQATSGQVGSAGSVSVSYYHQFLVMPGYTVVGGGSGYSAPDINCTQFGSSETTTSSSSVWMDAGSSYSYRNPLAGSASSERWYSATSMGTIGGAGTITASFHHQYSLTIGPASLQGGSVTPSAGWYDAGTTLQVSSSASLGWEFEGWTGTGSGSYSGPLNSTSIQLNGPITENASFYPGLKIIATDGGSVSYSYGSVSETVSPGTTKTVYVPPGMTISLSSVSSSFLYAFTGWTGASNRTTSQVQETLASPASLRANFSYNVAALSGIVVALVAVLVAGLLLYRRSPRHRPTALNGIHPPTERPQP